jgi:hypothetical protein
MAALFYEVVSGDMPPGMKLYSDTGAVTYKPRNSDAYRNLSLASKVRWLAASRRPFWSISNEGAHFGRIELDNFPTSPPETAAAKTTEATGPE